ncbi:MAG: hypothetical protein M1838_004812 [Thelocarpon superellum]|nr:MAG: hypothetical protein M1838_004812 [Thelocarpon superellum]
MKLPLGILQRAKTALHGVQGLLIFIAWAITIAILVAQGPTDGRPRWYFAVCWLSLPALIYQTMVPMWERAQKFVNAYAFAALDVLFAIFWFSAFIAVAVWNSAGISAGADKAHVSSGNCTTFAFGSEEKCKLSQATAGIGGLIFVLFLATSAISVYGVIYFRKNGHLPGQSSGSDSYGITAQTKEAFSTADNGDDEGHIGGADDDQYALLHSADNGDGRHPGRQVSWGGVEVHDSEPYEAPPVDYPDHELEGSYADAPPYDADIRHSYVSAMGDSSHVPGPVYEAPHGYVVSPPQSPGPLPPLSFPQADYSYRGNVAP